MFEISFFRLHFLGIHPVFHLSGKIAAHVRAAYIFFLVSAASLATSSANSAPSTTAPPSAGASAWSMAKALCLLKSVVCFISSAAVWVLTQATSRSIFCLVMSLIFLHPCAHMLSSLWFELTYSTSPLFEACSTPRLSVKAPIGVCSLLKSMRTGHIFGRLTCAAAHRAPAAKILQTPQHGSNPSSRSICATAKPQAENFQRSSVDISPTSSGHQTALDLCSFYIVSQEKAGWSSSRTGKSSESAQWPD